MKNRTMIYVGGTAEFCSDMKHSLLYISAKYSKPSSFPWPFSFLHSIQS